MRKRSTFEELASATLVKQKINPAPLPYSSPHDNTFAVMELGQMADRLKQERENAEDARYAEVHAARNLGVTPEHLRQMAEGIITAGSRMHEDTRAQAQHHDAASQRRFRLFADGYLQDEAERRRAAAQQQRTAEEIKSSLRGTTSSASAAAAAAQEGMSGPAAAAAQGGMSGPAAAATPPGGFQTPQAAPGTPADRFAQAFPGGAGDPGLGAAAAAADGYEPTPEQQAAVAAYAEKMEGLPSATDDPQTHKPKSNTGPTTANRAAVATFAQAKKALALKAKREKAKQENARPSSPVEISDTEKAETKEDKANPTKKKDKKTRVKKEEGDDTPGRRDHRKYNRSRMKEHDDPYLRIPRKRPPKTATDSQTGHLAAQSLIRGSGASSSNGPPITLLEFARDGATANDARNERLAGGGTRGRSPERGPKAGARERSRTSGFVSTSQL